MLFICNKLFPFKVHHDEIMHQSTFSSCRFNALMFKLHEVESKNILYYLRNNIFTLFFLKKYILLSAPCDGISEFLTYTF